MSKKANPTAIGLFIVTAVAVGVGGILLFSSSKLFTRTLDVIVYFDDTLNGLDEGAPVKYRGVTVGSVKRVMVHFNQATNDYAMPVILELEEKLLRERMGEQPLAFTRQAVEERVKGGLRATLQTESLVTGVLYVDMRYHPNAPPPVFHQLEKRYPEIANEPTGIQQIFKNLASLDIAGLATNLNSLLIKVDTVVGALNGAQINAGLTNALRSVDYLASSPQISNDLAAVHATLEQYRLLGERLNQRVDPLADSLTNSLAEANRSLQQMRGALENLRNMIAVDSPLRSTLELDLKQIAAAAQSISTLADFLHRHPNALITGREESSKRP
jgi:paraquat-inducible protein B